MHGMDFSACANPVRQSQSHIVPKPDFQQLGPLLGCNDTRHSRPNRECGPQGGAAEKLLSNCTTVAASMGECEPWAGGAACHFTTRHHRLRRDCAVTADLSSWDSGGARRTTCQSKHLKAPQTAGSDGAAGRSSSAEPGGWDVSLGILSTPQSCPKMCGVRHRNDHGFL